MDVQAVCCTWTTIPARSTVATPLKLRAKVQMQWDSNLVLYFAYEQQPTFASHTQNSGGSRVVMQGDGNLVMYRYDGLPAWASHIDGFGVGPYCLNIFEVIGGHLYGSYREMDLSIWDSDCKKRRLGSDAGRIYSGQRDHRGCVKLDGNGIEHDRCHQLSNGCANELENEFPSL
ncbi:Aste57867_23912 [Aphanomyces stellatus]|uniref:Aste57867_23912 protein n=1 Tax=Aphanomyces stellatus TaxID=120398 RepID=A0A485LP27_9STRA|nr:hypothetical protein As57867_023839 [Aphanomyces stellatus]VFU00555.1 Aste57867_23912 [Aphanomyces stellatus]